MSDDFYEHSYYLVDRESGTLTPIDEDLNEVTPHRDGWLVTPRPTGMDG